MDETKREIRCRLDELVKLREEFWSSSSADRIEATLDDRIEVLRRLEESAEESLEVTILASHRAICEAKQMGEKEAYGNDPALYYTLGVCGEAGEMANAITKAQRDGEDSDKVLDAVCSELPDIIIYSHILAHVLDIDLVKLVNEKARIVETRARAGYYGGPLKRP